MGSLIAYLLFYFNICLKCGFKITADVYRLLEVSFIAELSRAKRVQRSTKGKKMK